MTATSIVVIELPMSESVQEAIAELKARQEKYQQTLPEDERKPFHFMAVYELGSFRKELEQKIGEAREQLQKLMEGWAAKHDNISVNVREHSYQFQQQFTKESRFS